MPNETKSPMPIEFCLADVAARPEVLREDGSTLKQLSKARKLLSRQAAKQADCFAALEVIESLLDKGRHDLAVAMLLSREFSFATGDSPASQECRQRARALARSHKQVSAALEFARQRRDALSVREKDGRGGQFKKAVLGLVSSRQTVELGWVGEQQLWTLQNALPENDAAHNWDWTDSAWYAGLDLPYPFNQNTSSGRYATRYECLPANGWILYTRRLLKNDGIGPTTGVPVEKAVAPHYFALYNTRTAVLRVFVRFQQEASSYFQIVTKAFVSTGEVNNVLTSHGLFNNIGARSYCVPESALLEDNCVVSIATPKEDAWFITDYPLAYDRMGHTENCEFLNFYLWAYSTQHLTLEGGITSTSAGSDASGTSSAQAGLGVEKSNSSFTTIAKDVSSAGGKISEFGQWLSSNNREGGATLVTIGAAVAAQQYWIAAAIVGTQLIRTFLAMRREGGSTAYSYNEQTVRLRGDSTQHGLGTNASLLLSNVRRADPFELPYIFKAHPTLKLGLFRMTRRPLLEVILKNSPPQHPGGHLYQIRYDVDHALREIVELNPSIAGLSLTSLTYQIVFSKMVRAGIYEQPIDNPNIVRLGSGMTTEPDPANPDYVNIFNEEMVDPTGGITFGTIIDWGRNIGGHVPEYSGSEAILLRLRMKFNINGEQVADFLGSYEPDVRFRPAYNDTSFY